MDEFERLVSIYRMRASSSAKSRLDVLLDIERLGETVRARVREASGVMLDWEIIRLGLPKNGRPTGEALAEAIAAR